VFRDEFSSTYEHMGICEDNLDLMMRRLDGALNLVEQSTLEAHLRDCPRCTREFEYLRVSDCLLRAVGAPAVSEADWGPVFAEISEAAGSEEAPSLAATATEPPAVSAEEWKGVWEGIEREALLGAREDVRPAEIIPAVRKRSRLRLGAAAAAAAVVVLAAYIIFFVGGPRTMPPAVADEVKAGKGYAYTTVETGSEEPIYVIADINEIDYASASSGKDYMYSVSEDGSAIEIAPREAVEGGGEGPIEVPPGH
jgi:hypothetical protein